MKHNTKTPFALTLGASLVAGLSSTAINAEPFVMTDLSYNQTTNLSTGMIKVKDGSCGEGKCGGKIPSKVEDTVEGAYEDNEIDDVIDPVIESDDAAQEIITDEDEVTEI